MSQIVQFVLDFEEDVEKYLNSTYPKMDDYRILNKALDARGSNRGKRPRITYRVEIIALGEKFSGEKESFKELGQLKAKPIIIGAGPGGLFCALRLAEYGVASIVIERGERAHKRMKHIARFWRYGEFNTENNVCYGEGGAGLFSDGKLITRVKSAYVQYVMNRLVDFGAPAETAYVSNPHLGSNKIRMLINKISDFLLEKNCEILYNTRVEELIYKERNVVGVRLSDGREIYSDHIILATGHSAKEIYSHLNDNEVAMKAKDFAVGVRIEHPRELIDQIQYGKFAGSYLGAARYRLSYENKSTQKGTYSFCMCPGGYVLSSGTEAEGIVVNGMSNYARNSRWSNSALVVSVKASVDFSTDDVLNGLKFQHKIENKAYEVSKTLASGKELPSQTLKDFLDGTVGKSVMPKTSTPSGIVEAQLTDILPEFISNHLKDALVQFDRRMDGFVSKKALLLAPETRTSAPITILRDRETLESTSHKGLYPCGEGAGHAGGITSAAVDGVKIAMSILKQEKGLES
ncbi:NAD(P)/FAD-dependent oxidoreductase [Halobacteriovorax sp. HLS]|uniref:NAD(P)/FAD-dependent oxidoreductase n=1 Tax=Halobacteriovorax sp. HLS TaxID=2234000 RepID=UPI000FDA5F30|nr:NAD(P)/FAD-dependent oxidoreductase [Halobacteriovorax sp. HLS]